MRSDMTSCVFPVIVLTFVILCFSVQHALAGGRDPSLDKPLTQLNCEELAVALRAAQKDGRNISESLQLGRRYLDAFKGDWDKSKAKVANLQKDVSAETDPGEKKALRTELNKGKAEVRQNKSNYLEAKYRYKNAQRAEEQNNQRQDRIIMQMSADGC